MLGESENMESLSRLIGRHSEDMNTKELGGHFHRQHIRQLSANEQPFIGYDGLGAQKAFIKAL
jgi:hypothetical protein